MDPAPGTIASSTAAAASSPASSTSPSLSNALRALTITKSSSVPKLLGAARGRTFLIARRNRRNRRIALSNRQQNFTSTASSSSDSNQSWTLSSRGDLSPPLPPVEYWMPYYNRLFTARIYTWSSLDPAFNWRGGEDTTGQDHTDHANPAEEHIKENLSEDCLSEDNLRKQDNHEEEELLKEHLPVEDVDSKSLAESFDLEEQKSCDSVHNPYTPLKSDYFRKTITTSYG